MSVHEVRSRKDHRGVAAIPDALPFIIALIVGGVLVFILLYFGSFLVTRGQDD
jgi:ABC-type multidrug transport system permease subunit